MDRYHEINELERIGEKVMQIVRGHYRPEEPDKIVDYMSREQVLGSFDFDRPPRQGRDPEEVLEEFRTRILPHSVKTWHPKFLNQMFAGTSFPAIVGDMLASMMNPTLATWEMSPIGTYIEKAAASWMAQVLGMPPGSNGIFLPGSSLANLLALMVARHRRLGPAARTKGIDRPCAILTSAASHYSIPNAANLMGIGTDRAIRVDVNARGEMDPQDLEARLRTCFREGVEPLAIVATLGITVTGGFDPLSDIAAISRKYGVHLHVDAAFGGGMAFTPRAAELFAGIDQVDSITWDAHKFFHAPLTCTALLVPDFGVLKATFSHRADYLFHPQEDTMLEDLAKSTILCGKRFDALKIWLLWQIFGTQHFETVATQQLELAQRCYELLKRDPAFSPAYEPVSPLLCFRYLAQGLEDDIESSNKIHRWIRESARKRGVAAFNISNLNGRDQFRMVLVNPLTRIEHIEELLEDIKSLAREYRPAERAT